MHNQTESIQNLDSIIQHLEKKDSIMKLLKEHQISKITSVESVLRYQKDANRGGLIITGKEECSGQTEKILIDFKLGDPSINQVYDAIYETGKDCSKRIIMFGGLAKDEVLDPATNEYVVGSLITSMNHYQLNLYFVQLDCIKFETYLRNLDLVGDIFWMMKFTINDLPSIERFREAEFWNVYYDSLKQRLSDSLKAFRSGFNNKSKYGRSVINFVFEFKVEWTNDGAFFTVMETSDNTDYLKEIWQTKKGQLQQLFQDQEIQFICLPGKLPKIAIKYWDHPLNCLVNASNAEKMEFAKLLHSQFYDLVGFMDIKLWGIIDAKPMPER
jgi:hypothetical protein